MCWSSAVLVDILIFRGSNWYDVFTLLRVCSVILSLGGELLSLQEQWAEWSFVEHSMLGIIIEERWRVQGGDTKKFSIEVQDMVDF